MSNFFENSQKKSAAVGKIAFHSASFVLNLPFHALALAIFGMTQLCNPGTMNLPAAFLVGVSTEWRKSAVEGVKDNCHVLSGEDSIEEQHSLLA